MKKKITFPETFMDYLRGEGGTCTSREHCPVRLVKPFDLNPEVKILYDILGGLGKFEWEQFLYDVLLNAIEEANLEGAEAADVTEMFSYDFHRMFYGEILTRTQEEIYHFLLERLFDVVEETHELLIVKFKDALVI